MTDIVAQAASDLTSVNGILMLCNGALAVAIRKIYADCRTDREKLWSHIRQLESKLSSE